MINMQTLVEGLSDGRKFICSRELFAVFNRAMNANGFKAILQVTEPETVTFTVAKI